MLFIQSILDYKPIGFSKFGQVFSIFPESCWEYGTQAIYLSTFELKCNEEKLNLIKHVKINFENNGLMSV